MIREATVFVLLLTPVGWMRVSGNRTSMAVTDGRSAPGREVRATGPPRATGSIAGTITLGGDSLPLPTRVLNSTDPEACGREHTLDDLVVSPKDRGIRWVIVSLDGVPENAFRRGRPRRVELANRDCSFSPHALVATVGDTVVAVNQDSVLHNTHYHGVMHSNLALVGRGASAARVARVPGLVTILCDVHGWMRGYLQVDPHPFHAVTDAGGRFRIDGIPPGRYVLKLWQEKLGTKELPVDVRSGHVTRVNAEYPPPSN